MLLVMFLLLNRSLRRRQGPPRTQASPARQASPSLKNPHQEEDLETAEA
jgi:hypothetical protein